MLFDLFFFEGDGGLKGNFLVVSYLKLIILQFIEIQKKKKKSTSTINWNLTQKTLVNGKKFDLYQ